MQQTGKDRPTFYTEKHLPIRAGGLLFYTNYMGKVYIMIQEVINKRHFKNKTLPKYVWTDLGGKTDPDDITINDTICREVLEETNLKLFPNGGKYPYNIIPWLNRLKQYLTLHSTQTIFLPESKYQVKIVKFNHQNFNPKIFNVIKYSDNKSIINWIRVLGTIEHLNNTPRKIGWIEINDFLEKIDKSPNKLHIRLNTEIFIGAIKTLIV